MRVTCWRAMVLVLSLPSLLNLGTGCDRVFGLQHFDQPAASEPNADTCRCDCFPGTGDEIARNFNVCVAAANDPNTGGTALDNAGLDTDCNTRVRGTFLAILEACGTSRIRKKLQDGGDAQCSCASFHDAHFVDVCDDSCNSVQLANDCSNQQDATSVAGMDPICLAEPSASGTTPMARAIFGNRSTCAMSGDVTVQRDDEHQTKAATAEMEVSGGPCPGTTCAVDVEYRIDHIDTFHFESFADLASVDIHDIRAAGATLASTTLDTFGNGDFGPLTTSTSGRGTRSDEELGGLFGGDRTAGFVGQNVDDVGIGADWAGHQCALTGSLLGAAIEDADTSVTANFTGTILNEPPSANAGANRNVECTSSAGATVHLTAAASTDPEGNIVFRAWRLGGPGGTEIDDPDGDGAVDVSQALGTTKTYALNVVDAFADVSQTSTNVSVVDSTPPTITSVSATPNVLSPPNHKMRAVTVAVGAQDTCGTASCSIASITSNEVLNGKGDGNTDVDYEITGPLTANLRAERAAKGTGRVYTITVSCGDATGNASTKTVQVSVPK